MKRQYFINAFKNDSTNRKCLNEPVFVRDGEKTNLIKYDYFSINELIELEEVKKVNGEVEYATGYKVSLHPAVCNLINAFDYNVKEEETFDNLYEATTTVHHLKNKIKQFTDSLNDFRYNKTEILHGNIETLALVEGSDELYDTIEYFINKNKFTSIQQLRNRCEELVYNIDSGSEDSILKASKYFTKETFAILYMSLRDAEKREVAISTFIEKASCSYYYTYN